MKDLKSTKALLKFVLENYEKARNNDNYCYYVVCTLVAMRYDLKLERISVTDFLLSNATVFPPFESVRRSRAKLQAEYPYLAPCKRVRRKRAEREEVYREFARG